MTIQYFWKLIGSFHKDNLNKPIVTWPFIDITPAIARPTKLLGMKKKYGQPNKANGINKYAKINWVSEPSFFCSPHVLFKAKKSASHIYSHLQFFLRFFSLGYKHFISTNYLRIHSFSSIISHQGLEVFSTTDLLVLF